MAYYATENLAKAEVVTERRFTSSGPGDWYFLRLGDGKLLSLGDDREFADGLRWVIVRLACDSLGWERGTTNFKGEAA